MAKIKSELSTFDFSCDELSAFRKIVGSNVARLRKNKKITQLDLSHLIGYNSVSLISGAEIGYNAVKFKLDHLYKIAKVLDVDICEFFKQTYEDIKDENSL